MVCSTQSASPSTARPGVCMSPHRRTLTLTHRIMHILAHSQACTLIHLHTLTHLHTLIPGVCFIVSCKTWGMHESTQTHTRILRIMHILAHTRVGHPSTHKHARTLMHRITHAHVHTHAHLHPLTREVCLSARTYTQSFKYAH